ncbi:MAG: nfo [Firmicutes bacterium]|nr:nfo [Bacillota bacterium]
MGRGEGLNYAQFGPAGNPDAFYEAGGKASIDMPSWLKSRGLEAYEYQCSRGVTIKEETARKIGEAAKENGVRLSIHAPYYISLATEDETIAANTKGHILKSLRAAQWMGADRVVFHIGGSGKQERMAAIKRAGVWLGKILEEAERQGLLEGVYLAPETMGKANLLGNLQEVIEFCKLHRQLLPTLDFGHLHAVTGGQYLTKKEYEDVFDLLTAELGEKVCAMVHVHFSRIEFTKAGERRHWTFDDPYGPPFEPFIEVIAQRGYTPRVICESAGTQERDAKRMREYYHHLIRGNV